MDDLCGIEVCYMLSYSRGSGFDSRLGLVNGRPELSVKESGIHLEKLAGFARMRNGVDRGFYFWFADNGETKKRFLLIVLRERRGALAAPRHHPCVEAGLRRRRHHERFGLI